MARETSQGSAWAVRAAFPRRHLPPWSVCSMTKASQWEEGRSNVLDPPIMPGDSNLGNPFIPISQKGEVRFLPFPHPVSFPILSVKPVKFDPIWGKSSMMTKKILSSLCWKDKGYLTACITGHRALWTSTVGTTVAYEVV